MPEENAAATTLRTCDKCNAVKPLEDFPKHGKYGRLSTCKDCLTSKARTLKKAIVPAPPVEVMPAIAQDTLNRLQEHYKISEGDMNAIKFLIANY